MQHINDADADYFEHSNSNAGPDIAQEVDQADLQALLLARRSAEAADAALASSVRAARAHGVTWQAIGAILGVTRQAAHAKYSQVA
ncbi:MAG: hypothetical protein Q4F65_04945 [Propionibacteriaceae bacterium]|nr:hypothetical protein [Propionibacteriaceae bacterium]